MPESSYNNCFLKNPWGIPHDPDVEEPAYIGIGQEEPVEGWDEPLTQVLRPYHACTYIQVYNGRRDSLLNFH